MRRGLTLVELLISITVIVVLLALLAPRMRIISDGNRVNEAARLVSSQIAQASSRSLANGRRLLAPDEYELGSLISRGCIYFHLNPNMEQDEVLFGTTTIQSAQIIRST